MLAEIKRGSTPFTPRSFPSSPNSPTRIKSFNLGICTELALSMATAMARSRCAPSFFTSAGARLTVIIEMGNFFPLFFIAERTLSLDSFTAVSGSPTISNLGSPLLISTSTSMGHPSIPTSAKLLVFANIILSFFVKNFVFNIFDITFKVLFKNRNLPFLRQTYVVNTANRFRKQTTYKDT